MEESPQLSGERPEPEQVAANLGPLVRVACGGWAAWHPDLPPELAALVAPPLMVTAQPAGDPDRPAPAPDITPPLWLPRHRL